MQEQMHRHTEPYKEPENYSKQNSTSSKNPGSGGDYIDFEEIKD